MKLLKGTLTRFSCILVLDLADNPAGLSRILEI